MEDKLMWREGTVFRRGYVPGRFYIGKTVKGKVKLIEREVDMVEILNENGDCVMKRSVQQINISIKINTWQMI